MGDKYTEAQAAASKRFIAATYDEIKVRVPKGKKEEYKKKAADAGKSLNQFICDLVEQA